MAEIQYFKNILNKEIKRLTQLHEKWEQLSANTVIPDDAYGKILSVIGQTKLLIGDKLQQFRSLINTFKNDTKNITLDDLQGFWDLVNLQIQDVNEKFTSLEILKQNNWVPIEIVKPLTSTPVKHKRKNSISKSQSEAAKIRLAAAKLEIQARMNQDKTCIKNDGFYY